MMIVSAKLPVHLVANVSNYAAMCGLSFDEALADLAAKSLNRINPPKCGNPAFAQPCIGDTSTCSCLADESEGGHGEI